jgi:predicted nucleic acid-binding protein
VSVQKSLFQYVLDSSSLINIDREKKMNILRKRKGDVLIPEKVAYEVAYDPQIRLDDRLRKFILRYPELVTQFQKGEEEEYLRIRRQAGIHDADAAAIAIALKRRLQLVIDDKKAKLKAESHGVQTLPWDEFVRC